MGSKIVKLSTIFTFVLFIFTVLSFLHKANAAILDVGSGQTYATVAAAHTAANATGDTILIHGVVTEGAQVVLTKSVTIQGATGPGTDIIQDATSLGLADNRLFFVNTANLNLTFQDLTVRYGKEAAQDGGCFNIGGNNTNVTFDNVVIEDCQGNSQAGAIQASSIGQVTITDSTIQNNTSVSYGGAIYAVNTDLVITNSTFDGNTATAFTGGAVFFRSILSEANTMTVTGSLFSNNVTGSAAGGIMYQVDDDDTGTITNSTFSGNQSLNGSGLYMDTDTGTTADLTVNFVTFADNNNSTIYLSDGGANPNLIINNSILDCLGTCYNSSGGSTVTRIYSLASDATMSATGTGNLNSTDPLLSALADNGGPTQTHAIDSTSPAYEAANNTGAPISDQRGKGRFNTYEMGAFEVQDPFLISPAIDSSDNEIVISYYLTDEQQVNSVQMVFDNGTDTVTLTLDESTKDVFVDFTIPSDGDLSGISEITASSDPTIDPNETYTITLTYTDVYGNATSTDITTNFLFDTQEPYVVIVYGSNLDGPAPITTTQIFVGEQPSPSTDITITIEPGTTMDYENFSCADDPGAYDFVCDIDILSSGYFVFKAVDAAGNINELTSPTYSVTPQSGSSSQPIIIDKSAPVISSTKDPNNPNTFIIKVTDDTGINIEDINITPNGILIESFNCNKISNKDYECTLVISDEGDFEILVIDTAGRKTTQLISNKKETVPETISQAPIDTTPQASDLISVQDLPTDLSPKTNLTDNDKTELSDVSVSDKFNVDNLENKDTNENVISPEDTNESITNSTFNSDIVLYLIGTVILVLIFAYLKKTKPLGKYNHD
ncbi:hypothetical protein KC678_05445 [Candidatus Dojkabacteria bacterium]|uniref:Right-handed parallel beta-helix repeat-containing protein n=1 Tax=Candidatus Dojkabacteria bacterium TaxID=2099670 RepID=A0A955L2G8_9BACT|nr:hypothetical protein [Candidatus Dojkabacteria bacterium]